jgi:DNA-3-methyladenine glycosylase I
MSFPHFGQTGTAEVIPFVLIHLLHTRQNDQLRNEGVRWFGVGTRNRCGWVSLDDPLYLDYHDKEWGVPVHDDRTLFEFLVLEGAQAGLSWGTILRKRVSFRRAFDDFDPQKVSLYDERKVTRLLGDSGIIRNKLKIRSAITNAKALLKVQAEFGSFDAYNWRFVGGKTKVNRWRKLGEIPPSTPESEAMSKDLIARGFRFVGPTICYAHMQATGMVNDHVTSCFRYRELLERTK